MSSFDFRNPTALFGETVKADRKWENKQGGAFTPPSVGLASRRSLLSAELPCACFWASLRAMLLLA